METAIWQNFNQEEVILVGISNTSNKGIISDFVEENGGLLSLSDLNNFHVQEEEV